MVIRYLADTPFFEALHPAARTPGYIIYILVDTNAVVAELFASCKGWWLWWEVYRVRVRRVRPS